MKGLPSISVVALHVILSQDPELQSPQFAASNPDTPREPLGGSKETGLSLAMMLSDRDYRSRIVSRAKADTKTVRFTSPTLGSDYDMLIRMIAAYPDQEN